MICLTLGTEGRQNLSRETNFSGEDLKAGANGGMGKKKLFRCTTNRTGNRSILCHIISDDHTYIHNLPLGVSRNPAAEDNRCSCSSSLPGGLPGGIGL